MGSCLFHLRFSWQYSGSGTEASPARQVCVTGTSGFVGEIVEGLLFGLSEGYLPFGQGG